MATPARSDVLIAGSCDVVTAVAPTLAGIADQGRCGGTPRRAVRPGRTSTCEKADWG